MNSNRSKHPIPYTHKLARCSHVRRWVFGVLACTILMLYSPRARGQVAPMTADDSRTMTLDFVFIDWSKDNRPSSEFSLFCERVHDALKNARHDDSSGGEYVFGKLFPTYTVRSIEYSDSIVPKVLRRNIIGFLTAQKYAELTRNNRDAVVPLFVLTNGKQNSPYYSASIIVATGSKIDSVRSSSIRRVFHTGPGSLTGHTAALDYLWRQGVIQEPSIAGCREVGWQIEGPDQGIFRSPDVVSGVSNDPTSIGFVWYDAYGQFEKSGTRTLACFGLFPNETIVISKHLSPYKEKIEGAIRENASLLNGAPLFATGVRAWSDELASATSYVASLSHQPSRSGWGTPILRPMIFVPGGTLFIATVVRVLRSRRIWDQRWKIRRRLGRVFLIFFSSVIDAACLYTVLIVLLFLCWIPLRGGWGPTLLDFAEVPARSVSVWIVSGALLIFLGIVTAATNVFQVVARKSPALVQSALDRIGGDPPAASTQEKVAGEDSPGS